VTSFIRFEGKYCPHRQNGSVSVRLCRQDSGEMGQSYPRKGAERIFICSKWDFILHNDTTILRYLSNEDRVTGHVTIQFESRTIYKGISIFLIRYRQLQEYYFHQTKTASFQILSYTSPYNSVLYSLATHIVMK
jgi:hypothetical protein